MSKLVVAFLAFLVGAIVADVTHPKAVGHCTYAAPRMTDISKEQIDFLKRMREGK